MTPEGRVLRSICVYLDALKPRVWYAKIRGGPYSVRGLPDILGCFCGRLFAVEVKAGRGDITKLQEHVLRSIMQANGSIVVARSVGDVENLLANLRGS